MPLNVQGNFRNKGSKVDFTLPVIKFKEDEVYFVYTPSLDLTGYGKSDEDAQTSFEETLAQFFDYTTNKKTLGSELKKLGWKVTKKALKSPSLSEMLLDNKYLADIFDEKSYSKFDKTVSIPAFA
ncbi:MAG: hypothetical protein WKF87_13260 [Chryseolinea sp.]